LTKQLKISIIDKIDNLHGVFQMTRVTSTEFQQAVGNFSDTAMREPVIITSHNRDRLVLMSIEEYQRLKEMEEAVMDKETEKLIDERIDVHRSTLEKLAQR
jgi:prevent-host-death family protein